MSYNQTLFSLKGSVLGISQMWFDETMVIDRTKLTNVYSWIRFQITSRYIRYILYIFY